MRRRPTMATIDPSRNGHAELKPAAKDPEVTETAIEDVNRLRQTAREDREHRRSATEDAEAAAKSGLDTVREGFHTARESDSPNRDR
jgi:hypothetical protein